MSNHMGADAPVFPYVRKGGAVSLIALCVASGFAQQALAQEAGSSASTAAPEGRAVIVVTAQRREESLQTVPISISAIGGDDLDNAGITDAAALEHISPGVIFGESGRDGQIFVRGIGSTRLSGAGADPSSSVYIDGVYRSRGASALLSFLDLERVEVLRGPQGTLYGRNSTGGAVRYISEDPSNTFGGKASVGIGNYEAARYMVQADVPIVDDTVLFRGAFLRSEHTGYTENILHPGETFGRQNLNAYRGTLKFIPSDAIDIVLHAGYSKDDSDQTALKHYVDPLGPFGSAVRVDDPWKMRANYGPRNAPVENFYADGTVNWDAGPVVFTSITGYNSIDVGPYTGDLDGTEISGVTDGFGGAANGIADGGETFTQEFTLASTGDGPLQWTTGLYYLHDSNYTLRQGLYVPLIASLAANHRTFNAFGETTAYAAFANGSWFLTDHLRLNAGIRFNRETKEIQRERRLNFALEVGPRFDEKTWESWTPKVGVDYVFNDDMMVYASYSQGFKSGAFNASSFDPAVNPENVDAYEVGGKFAFRDLGLVVNGSAFHYDYADLQVQGLDPNNIGVEIVRNAAQANIDGAELEVMWEATRDLTFNVGLAWLDATYEDFPTLAGNLAGNKLPNAPEYTANVGVNYLLPLGGLGDLNMNANYYYSAEKFLSETNNPVNAYQDAYGLLNAKMTFTPANGPWEFSIYGANLTDEVVFSRTVTQSALLRTGYLAYQEPPRTYGAELLVHF